MVNKIYDLSILGLEIIWASMYVCHIYIRGCFGRKIVRICKTAPSYFVAITLIYSGGGGVGERKMLIFVCMVKYLDHQFIPVSHPCWLLGLCRVQLALLSAASVPRQRSVPCCWRQAFPGYLTGAASAMSLPCSFSGDELNFSFCSYCNPPGAAWVFFFLFLLKKTSLFICYF